MNKKNTMIIAVLVIVVVCIVVAAVALTNDDSNDDSDKKRNMVTYSDSLDESQINEVKDQANDNSNTYLKVTAGDSSVTFNSKAISNLTPASLSITSQSVPDTLDGILSADALVYSVSFGDNTNFGDGSVTISLPYTGKSTDGAFDAYYLDGSNKVVEKYDCSYSDGQVSFTTNHFSTFVVNFVATEDVRFAVYGNVNGDDVLDENDKTFLSKLLDSGLDTSRYPYADANYDGVINETDVAYIQDLIDYKTDTKAYFLDAVNVVSSVTFPFQSYGLIGTSTLVAAMVLDIVDQVKSLGNASSKDPLYSQFWDIGAKNGYFSADNSSFNYGMFSKIQQSLGKDRMDGVIACMPMGYSGLAQVEDNEYVDVVKLPFSSGRDVGSYLILGYLTNKVDRAVEYAALSDSITDKIAQAQEKFADDLTEVLPAFGSATMGGGFVTFLSPDTQYSQVMADAGAKIIKNAGDQSVPGQSTVSVKDADWLADPRFNTLDRIVCMVQGTPYISEVTDYSYEYETIMSHDGYAYLLKNVVPEQFYVVNWSLPYPIMLAYLFECFYPSEVSDGYGDEIHQEFYDKYLSGSSYGTDFKVTDHKFFFGYDDFKEL